MQLQELTVAYAAKTDEELLELAGQKDQLTPEAFTALRGELSKRRLSFSTASQLHGETNRESTPSIVRDVLKTRTDHRVGPFLADVVRLYHANFWMFLKLTAPAALAGYFSVMLTRREVRELLLHPAGPVHRLRSAQLFIEIAFISLLGYFASWLACCFSFAAICSAVDHIQSDIRFCLKDTLLVIRERFGPILQVSATLFIIEVVLVAASGFLQYELFLGLANVQLRKSGFVIWLVTYSMLGLQLLLLSRLALAMPAVVLDDYRLFPSFFRSDELTKGKWLLLAGLLSKALIGGYVAAMLPFWINRWIWSYVQLPAIVLTTASMVAVWIVEPTIFIGFALLYLQMTAKPSELTLAPFQLGT